MSSRKSGDEEDGMTVGVESSSTSVETPTSGTVTLRIEAVLILVSPYVTNS